MKGSTHLAAGICAGAALANYHGMIISVEMIAPMAAATIGALAPDWIQLNLPGANKVVRGLTGHRGFSHWVLTAGGVWLVLSLAGWPLLALFSMAGMTSHIVLDMISGGVAALWPLSHRITLAKIKTGSQQDTIIGACALVLAAIILYMIWR